VRTSLAQTSSHTWRLHTLASQAGRWLMNGTIAAGIVHLPNAEARNAILEHLRTNQRTKADADVLVKELDEFLAEH
jgi:hypothetical protein